MAAFGLQDGTVLAIDSAGRVTRLADAGSSVTSMAPSHAGEPTVFVGTREGAILALATTGE